MVLGPCIWLSDVPYTEDIAHMYLRLHSYLSSSAVSFKNDFGSSRYTPSGIAQKKSWIS